jgi:hypothetical protein
MYHTEHNTPGNSTYRNQPVCRAEWPTLMDVTPGVNCVLDNQDRLWERGGDDWVTYGSFIQRWSAALTDLSGWGPFRAA